MAESSITDDYPWTLSPLIIGGPMRLISTSPLGIEVSRAGGLGFVAAGTDPNDFAPVLRAVSQELANQPAIQHQGRGGASKLETLPVGIGIINWGFPTPDPVIKALRNSSYPPPAAVWLFAPKEAQDLTLFTEQIREATSGLSKIWIQVCSVQQVVDFCMCAKPDVLVVQGQDAGGHGLLQSCGIISLVPEVIDVLERLYGPEGKLSGQKKPRVVAAGGIVDGRGGAAAIALGAEGIVMGTRYLTSEEANILDGYKRELVRASDGGQATVRSRVYDRLRGTDGWPLGYGGRGVTNASYEDAMKGMDEEHNKKLYKDALNQGDAGWGPNGRMTTYASTSVGLIHNIKKAGQITAEVREEVKRVIARLSLKNVS